MPTAPFTLELRYVVDTGPEGLPVAPSFRALLADFWPSGGRREVRVLVGARSLSAEWGSPATFSYTEDLTSGQGLWIDHRAREYVRRHRLAPELEAGKRWTAGSRGTRREKIGGQAAHLEQFFLQGSTLTHVSVLRTAVRSERVRHRLWEMMLPVAPDTVRAAGLPYEVLQQCPETPATRFVRVRLEDFRPLAGEQEDPTAPPKGYVEREIQRVRRKLSGRKAAARPPAAHHDSEMRRRHRLRSGGQDVAWAVRQSFLDRLRDAVNSVSPCFDNFRSFGDTLRIDWTNSIEEHFGRDGSGPDKLLSLQLLNLFRKVYQADPDASIGSVITTSDQHADGLTPDEVQAIDAAEPDPGCDDLDLDRRECRVLTLHSTLLALTDQARVDRAAAAEWRLLDFELELPRREVSEVWEDCLRVRLEDFTVEIILNEQPIIESLTYQDGDEIQMAVAVDEIFITFNWTTDLLGGCSVFGFFFLGPFGFIDLPGWGQFVAEDARIVIEFETSDEGRVIRLVPDLDVRESVYDGDLLLLSLNPLHLVVGLIVSMLESWFQAFNDTLLESFRDTIEDLLTVRELTWPRFWHAAQAPRIRPTAVLLSDDPLGGVFEGHLAQDRGLLPGIAEDIDWSEIHEDGDGAFVMSDRYLTAWVRRITPLEGATTRLSVRAMQDAVGVRLPRAESVPDEGNPPDVAPPVRPPFPGCDEPPPAPEAQYFNRIQLTRGAPRVVLPETGSQSVAGQLSGSYVLRVEAVRRDFLAQLHLTREPCARPPGDFFEGFGRFAGFEEPFIPPGWLRGEFAWLDRFAPAGEGFRRIGGTGAGIGPGGGAVGGGGLPRSDWGGGGGGDAPCPPPMCQWTFPGRDRVLLTYADALVRVTVDVVVGFSGREFWLPELRLGIVRDSVVVEIEDLSTEEPFVGALRLALQDYILTRVRQDIEAYLEPVLRDRPDAVRQFVPGSVSALLLVNGIPGDTAVAVSNLFSVAQAGNEDGLTYNVTENLVYWSFAVQQGFGDFFSNEDD